MKRKTWMRAAALGLALACSAALAQTDATTPAPGPMYGRAMPGYGMMGGYGPGYGMMGACPGNGYGCYGPGMMGGYGAGMMRGYGPGWSRDYGGGLSQLDLTADQQDRIARIAEDMRAKNWATMGELRGEQFKMRSLYSADKPDANAIAEQQRKVDELRRTLLKSRVDAHNQMASVLTKEQRSQLRAMGPWWFDEEMPTD